MKEKKKRKKFSWAVLMVVPFMFLIVPVIIKLMTNTHRKRQREKALARNFRVEITPGLFGNKIKYIQREKPLTDEELELMMKDLKPADACSPKQN
jgi:hypothetical protein